MHHNLFIHSPVGGHLGSFWLGLGWKIGLPTWLSCNESTCQCRRCRGLGFDLWVRKIPWRRKWQSTPVFLPGKSHGQRSLEGYSPWGHKESDMTEHAHTLICIYMPRVSLTACFLKSGGITSLESRDLQCSLPMTSDKTFETFQLCFLIWKVMMKHTPQKCLGLFI